MAIGRGITKGAKKYKSKKLTGRAKGSTMQKKQQEQKMNLDVGRAGSNQKLGTKGSLYRVLSSSKAGTVQGKYAKAREDKIMKSGKTSKSSEQKEAIKERKAIEAPVKELNALRRKRDALANKSKLTDAERKTLSKLRAEIRAIENKTNKPAKAAGSKKVKLATPSGKGKTVTVGDRAAKDAARSRLNEGVRSDAQKRKLKAAREKKEAEDKAKADKEKRLELMKKIGKKINKKKPASKKTSYEKRKGK